MSAPKGLSGEVAGRKTRGRAGAVALPAGKLMTRERETLEASGREIEALQGRERGGAAMAAETAVQAPAVAGVVEALAQQAQAEQLGASGAEAAQQQPPRQRLEAQSKLEAQASPGE